MHLSMRIALFFFLSLYLFSSSLFVHALPAPLLNSAVVSSDSLTVLLTFTPGQSTCPAMFCWFTVWVDGGAETNIYNDGSSIYYFTLYVNTDTYPAGIHSFYVTEGAMGIGTSPQSNTITVNVPSLTPASAPAVTPLIVGDPQFTGIRGQSYQIHGIANEVFSIISDVDLQYNSRFVFLQSGTCPDRDSEGNKVHTACFTHPGTYLGEIGLETQAGERIYIQAGDAQHGFSSVTLNEQPLKVGQYVDLTPSSVPRTRSPFVQLNSSHVLTVCIGNFLIEFTNSDSFVNQAVTMLDSSAESSHGLLGQTWATRIYNAAATIPWIEGEVWDYATADHELFSRRFVFNRFHAVRGEEEEEEDGVDDEGEEELKKSLREAEKALGMKLRVNERPRVAHEHSHRHQAHDE